MYVDAAGSAGSPGGARKLWRRLNEARALQPPLRAPRTYFNWLRANVEVLRRTSVIRSRPLKLTFDPTNVCQLRCPLCPTGARAHDRTYGRAETHVFEHLLQEVGDYVFLIDFFNWGEPLLNEHTEEMIALASRRRIVTVLSSNLSLPLSDTRIRRLVESGLSRLIVSLDGASAETYGVYRRLGRFDLVLENVARVLRARRAMGRLHPQVDWQYLVFSFNEHEIPRAQELAAELGVDRFTLRAPFLDEGRIPLSDVDRAAVASWAPGSAAFTRETADRVAVPPRPRCGWHYMSTAINWDGSVAPCCAVFERKDDFGRLGAQEEPTYMAVVNNAQFRAVRDSFSGKGGPSGLVCDRCPTPVLMSYHHHLNRQILLQTAAGVLNGLRHPWDALRRRSDLPPVQLTSESPARSAGGAS